METPKKADSGGNEPEIRPPAWYDDLRVVLRHELAAVVRGLAIALQPLPIKGPDQPLFQNQKTDGISDALDCRNYNAVHIDIVVSGALTAGVLTLEGAAADGAPTMVLPSVLATRRLSRSESLDCPVGSAFLRARLTGLSGTFGSGQGVTVIATPYRAAPEIQTGELLTLAPSAARTSSGTGSTLTGLGTRKRLIAVLDITASATEAGDTLDVYLDVSLDGSTWLNAVHFPQQAGNGAAAKYFAVLDPSSPGTSTVAVSSDASAGTVRPALWGPYLRARWAIADVTTVGNASHTFSLVAYVQ